MAAAISSGVAGSSPHTRGAPARAVLVSNRVGIIPAYAGSTSTRSLRTARRWDHPRIRGEHPKILATLMVLTGSSPHTRGARSSRHSAMVGTRIIPAYAGSTCGRCAGR